MATGASPARAAAPGAATETTPGATSAASTAGGLEAGASEASGANAFRGRSQSPGQYSSRGYGARPLNSARGTSHGLKGSVGGNPLAAWPEQAASPRTPRQHTGGAGSEYRLNVVIAELQRQAEAERRSVQRQLEHLERRQEQLAAPAAGRERWADLQGSVSGMLEEMSALSRRVEGLDEKLRSRIGGCEELVRQKTRELEQQLHAQQQKAALAVSTSEEMSKRHTARIRKISQCMEEHARRLAGLDEERERDLRERGGAGDALHVEARLCELEGQQASIEAEFRSLAAATESAAASAALYASADGGLRGSVDSSCGGGGGGLGSTCRSARDMSSDGEVDSAIRSFERDLARASATLDEHAAALANLRVRSDGQEQRLAATYERLETVVASPLEAFRSEVLQLRDRDRLEVESQIGNLARRVEAVADQGEEAGVELREGLEKLEADLRVSDPRAEDSQAIRRLAEQATHQEHAIRRLESFMGGTPKGSGSAAMMTEDLCDALARVESLEHRTECLEQGGAADELAEKADRTELMRLDAALQELSEPLRRLSQRTASGEAKSTALERQVERLRQWQEQCTNGSEGLPALPTSRHASEDLAALASAANARAEAVAQELGVVRARLIEMESQLDSACLGEAPVGGGGGGSLTGSGRLLALDGAASGGAEKIPQLEYQLGDLLTQFSKLAKKVETLEAQQLTGQERASLSDFRKKVEDQLQDVLRKQRESTSELSREVQQQLDDLRKRQEELDDVAGGWEESLEELKGQQSQQLQLYHQKVQDSCKEIALAKGAGGEDDERIAEVLDRMDEDRRASDSLHEQAQRRLDELRAGVEEINRRASEDQVRTAEQLRGIQDQEDAARELQQQLQSQLSRVEDKVAVQPTAGDASSVNEKLADVLKRVESSDASAQDLQRKLQQQMHQLEENHHKLTESVQAKDGQSVAWSEALDKMHGMEEQTNEISRDLLELQETVGQQLSRKHEVADAEVLQRVNGLEDQTSKIRQSFSDLQEKVDEQLNNNKSKEVEAEKVSADATTAAERDRRITELLANVEGNEVATQKLSRRLQEVEERGAGGEEMLQKISATGQRITKAEKAATDLQKDVERTNKRIEDRLDKLRIDHDLLSKQQQQQQLSTATPAPGTPAAQPQEGGEELAARVAEALKRASAGEEGLTELRKVLADEQKSLKDLSEQVQEAVQRVEASEAATMAVREELMTTSSPTATSSVPVQHEQDAASAAAAAAMETRVSELRKQVSAELDALQEHQKELSSKAGSAHSQGGSDKQVEQAVQDLSRQVEAELAELREHQRQLQEFRAKAASSANCTGGGGGVGAAGADSSTAGGAGTTLHDESEAAPRQLETRVAELAASVATELKALEAQQEELSQAKVTLHDIAGQMQDVRSVVAKCQSATGDLRQLVEAQNNPEEEETGRPKPRPLGGRAVKSRAKSGGGNAGARRAGQGDSEDSESYGDEDFEISAGLEDSA